MFNVKHMTFECINNPVSCLTYIFDLLALSCGLLAIQAINKVIALKYAIS